MAESLSPTSKRDILRLLFGRWLGILVILVVVVGSTVAATMLAPKWYRSKVGFESKRPTAINPLTAPQNVYLPTEVFLRTQQAVILSEDVVSRSLARLDGAKTEQRIVAAAADIRKNQRDRLRRQTKHIKVTTVIGENYANSEVFYITVELADDALKAQELATLIAGEYRARFDTLQNRPLDQSVGILEAEVAVLKGKLDLANGALADFINNKLKGDLVALRAISSAGSPLSVAAVAATFDAEAKNIQANLKEKAAIRVELEKELVRVGALPDLGPLDTSNIPVVPERLLKDNPDIQILAQKLTELRLKAIELEPRYTDDFRDRQNIAQEIRLTSQLLVDNLSRISSALAQDIVTGRVRMVELQNILAEDQAYMKELSGKYVEYESLNDEIESAKNAYVSKKEQLTKAKTAQSVASENVFLTQLDTASLPDKPFRPNLLINTLVAAFVGLLLALGYGFMADYYDHRFKTVEQAEDYLGVPVLGSVRNLGYRIIVRR